MRDNKIFPLLFIALMTTIIVANSDMHFNGKLIIFVISALCMLLAGYLAAKPYIQRRKEKA
ncbi:hypothetical protein [Planococcus halotolerans]|uniref:Uncharacterized protein n=1 Tax=Planococcus halotolerans TaxID=2233542 RepID=A0A365KWT3_9BACL|nr:hypothetical protein [Planococcus halotolerans]QHJ69152.1 hypothetical protein DNR44_000175 [Planococcus halotolerans]RAZ77646.1 hypothetical protein DP120_09185 [Planococcus halotolerans]